MRNTVNQLELYQKNEKEIMNFLVRTHKTESKIGLVLLKGLSSLLKASISTSIPASFAVGTKIVPMNINLPLSDIFASSFNEKPKSILSNRALNKLLQNYYGSICEGDVEGNRENKSKATDYYKEAFRAADRIQKNHSSVFEKNEWLLDLLIADSLSYLGSINTSTQNFQEGTDNYDNSLIIIDKIFQEYNVEPTDRAVEIAGFSLSNDLRDRATIEKFLASGGIKEYDQKYTKYVTSRNTEYDRFTYAVATSDSMYNYVIEKYIPQKKYENEYYELAKNLYKIMKNKHQEKMNRSFGKYLTIRGCFDFILARFNLGDQKVNISQTEQKIIQGLEQITKSYFKTEDMNIESYLSNELFYYSPLQKDLGRNFTILYGLGVLFSNDELTKKYLGKLTDTYRKEFVCKGTDYGDIFKASINTSLKNVLAPFGLTIQSDDLVSRLNDELKKRSPLTFEERMS